MLPPSSKCRSPLGSLQPSANGSFLVSADDPAKITDSRATKYIEQYGNKSWELDALEPRLLTNLIQTAVSELLDQDLWDSSEIKEDKAKQRLRAAVEAL
jgi:hypothetical protein